MSSNSQGVATPPDLATEAFCQQVAIEMQHQFADASKHYDWEHVNTMPAEVPSLLNTQAPYPAGMPWPALHQAIHNSSLGQVTKRGREQEDEAGSRLRAVIAATPAAPTEGTDPTLNRLSHRFRGQKAVMLSADYIDVALNAPDLLPCGPSPWDRTISKRDWEKQMAAWRHALSELAHFFFYGRAGEQGGKHRGRCSQGSAATEASASAASASCSQGSAATAGSASANCC